MVDNQDDHNILVVVLAWKTATVVKWWCDVADASVVLSCWLTVKRLEWWWVVWEQIIYFMWCDALCIMPYYAFTLLLLCRKAAGGFSVKIKWCVWCVYGVVRNLSCAFSCSLKLFLFCPYMHALLNLSGSHKHYFWRMRARLKKNSGNSEYSSSGSSSATLSDKICVACSSVELCWVERRLLQYDDGLHKNICILQISMSAL